MSAGITIGKERVEVRTAKAEYRCWSYEEDCYGPGHGWDDEPTCTRLIAPGEQYVVSTIFPGHDSGYADNRVKWTGAGWESVPSSPIASRFCLPCARRWRNTRERLDRIEAAS